MRFSLECEVIDSVIKIEAESTRRDRVSFDEAVRPTQELIDLIETWVGGALKTVGTCSQPSHR